jgi:hypothetical protein
MQDAGVPSPQAEAHAEAARDFAMRELATKSDLLLATDRLKTEMDKLKSDMTIRLGSLIVAGLAVMAVIERLR